MQGLDVLATLGREQPQPAAARAARGRAGALRTAQLPQRAAPTAQLLSGWASRKYQL